VKEYAISGPFFPVREGGVDSLSEDYLFTKAIAGHKTPTEIIGELVREKTASSSV
jgi:hypothetical protein